MHALIVGQRGVGKSARIRRVLKELNMPLFGFETKKEAGLAEMELGEPVYIYEAGKPHIQGEENLVGYCGKKDREQFRRTFEWFAPRLREEIPEDSIVLLDELGIMESEAADFCGAVLSLLDGDNPVIAAVKPKDTAFLQAVRGHEKCRCFYITPENREALFEEVLAFMWKEVTAWQEKH